MIDEILPGLYRIEIPLPESPLKVLNSYLIKTPDKCLMIDSGYNRDECREVMSGALKKLDVDLNKTDFFITHLHADHLGLAVAIASPTSTMYFNRREAGMVAGPFRREKAGKVYESNGFPRQEMEKAMAMHPALKYGAQKRPDFHILGEGDRLEIGDYSFRAIETPGHSPGHLCLYDAAKKLLVAGDHILFDITPNIAFWLELVNPLQDYLDSLEKVYGLEVETTLPGHRTIMSDHRKRIRELRAHHNARANEVLSALGEGDKNAWEIAPRITWDIVCKSWSDFPPQQKWFAFGETLSHLYYLRALNKIREKKNGSQVRFSLV